MKTLRRFAVRLMTSLFGRPGDERVRVELEEHLALMIEAHVRAGLPPQEARRRAKIALGTGTVVAEACRDELRLSWIADLAKDVRYGLRMVRRNPGFGFTVCAALAIGIGANTAVFGVVNAFLFRPLPVAQPHALVLFRTIEGAGGRMARGAESRGFTDPTTGRFGSTSFSLLTFQRFREHTGALSHVFAFAPLPRAAVAVNGEAEGDVSVQLVSGDYFTGLGVPAISGRTIAPDDDAPHAVPVAVISERFRQRHFGSSMASIGHTLSINGVATTIIGVTPAGFNGTMQAGDTVDVSVPLAQHLRFQPNRAERSEPWYWWVRIMGRLRPGETQARAAASLEALLQSTAREGWLAGRSRDSSPRPTPDAPLLRAEPGFQGENDVRREHGGSLALLSAFAVLVFLSACANVANLLLARATNRKREIAVRLALGAGRGRVVRENLCEAMVLASLGALLGSALAILGQRLILALRPFGNHVVFDLSVDVRMVAFVIALTVGTTFLIGLAPALLSTRAGAIANVRQTSRSKGSDPKSRLARALIVAQVWDPLESTCRHASLSIL